MTDPQHPLAPHGGYERLRAYKLAEAIYESTVVFCDRFLDKRSRTHDQMIQAARSGVRNISEGSGAAATSKKTEIRLTNVARASLADELLHDYRSFLTQRNLPVWHKESPEARAMRSRLRQEVAPNTGPPRPDKVRLSGLAGLADFVRMAAPELAANALICAIHQATYLLRRLVERQNRDFIEKGGFSENLYAARTEARKEAKTGTEHKPSSPPCPLCGRPMRQREARRGPHAGRPFWGCPDYPACKGLVDMDAQ